MLKDSIDLLINDSNREMLTPNKLMVKNCILTEATVNEYLGKEIKNYQQAGLEADKIYKVYRPLEEIEKAISQYNGLDLVDEHHAINGEKTNRHLVVGHSGESAKIEDYKLYNTIFVTDKEAIKDIQLATKTKDQIGKRKLSCSYDYTPIFEKGEFRGKSYDVRITDLILDHVALVQEGRVTSAKINDSIKKVNIMKDFVKNALKGIFGIESINDSQIEQVMLLADKAKDNVEYEGKAKEEGKYRYAKDNEEEKKKEEMKDEEEEKETEDKKAKDNEETKKKELEDEEEKKAKEKEELEKSISDAVNKEIIERLELHNNCAKVLNVSRLSDSAMKQDKNSLITETLTKCGIDVKNKSFNDKKIMLEALVSANILNNNKNVVMNDSRASTNNKIMYTASDFK